jgi:ribonuclease BN (tRNA processing enzyme)
MSHQALRQDNQLPIDLIHLHQDHIAQQMEALNGS